MLYVYWKYNNRNLGTIPQATVIDWNLLLWETFEKLFGNAWILYWAGWTKAKTYVFLKIVIHWLDLDQIYLTDLFPMHSKVFWCFQVVEKGCVGNKWFEKLD